MTPAEVARLLAGAAMFDYRKIDRDDALAWHHVLGDLDFDDAIEAVRRHYAESTERLMPAHVRQGVRAIRNERASRTPNAVRELPSRFEDDLGRDLRAQRGAATVREVLAQITDHLADKAGPDAPGIDELRAITAGPDWAAEGAR
jgi:hypothetical protein